MVLAARHLPWTPTLLLSLHQWPFGELTPVWAFTYHLHVSKFSVYRLGEDISRPTYPNAHLTSQSGWIINSSNLMHLQLCSQFPSPTLDEDSWLDQTSVRLLNPSGQLPIKSNLSKNPAKSVEAQPPLPPSISDCGWYLPGFLTLHHSPGNVWSPWAVRSA